MSARVLFGFFLGLSSIAVPALAIDAGADLGGASIGGRTDGASARVGASVDWVSEAEPGGSVGSGESDSSSPSIGGGTNLDPMALWQARVQASTGSVQLRPAARWEAVPILVAKNEGSGASGSGKGGTASGSQGKGNPGPKAKAAKGARRRALRESRALRGRGNPGPKAKAAKGAPLGSGSQGNAEIGDKRRVGRCLSDA